MRTGLIAIAILLVSVGVWIAAAQSISLFLDRVRLNQLTSTAVQQLRFDNGTFHVAGIRLGTLTPGVLPSGVKISLTRGGRLELALGGKTFPFGAGKSIGELGELPDYTAQPDAGDEAILTTGQSLMSWPTPFEMNFMTGYAPTWRRNAYCKLTWAKRSGARLEMVWRIPQGWFQTDGWRPAKIDYVTVGLLPPKIIEVNDLEGAAIEYLARVKQWPRVQYRLISEGPTPDATGERITASHLDDDKARQPGAGASVQLILDYRTRKVVREVGLQ